MIALVGIVLRSTRLLRRFSSMTGIRALVTPRHFGYWNGASVDIRASKPCSIMAGKPDPPAELRLLGASKRPPRLEVHPSIASCPVCLIRRVSAGCRRVDAFVAHIFACFGADRVMWGSDCLMVTGARPIRMARHCTGPVRRHAQDRFPPPPERGLENASHFLTGCLKVHPLPTAAISLLIASPLPPPPCAQILIPLAPSLLLPSRHLSHLSHPIPLPPPNFPLQFASSRNLRVT